jgi:hypothetical protein
MLLLISGAVGAIADLRLTPHQKVNPSNLNRFARVKFFGDRK